MIAGSHLVYSAEQVQQACDALGATLNRELPDGQVQLLVVMTGGMLPACELARRIDRPLVFDYVHATRYRGATRGRDVQWLHWPDRIAADGTILVVDDIFDEGHTLKAIHDRLPNPERVFTVTLVRKLHDRGLPRDWVDFHALDVEDKYVFGCGMDWAERYRELPEIRALDEEGD